MARGMGFLLEGDQASGEPATVNQRVTGMAAARAAAAPSNLDILEGRAAGLRPLDGAAEGAVGGDGRGDIHQQRVEQGVARRVARRR